MNLSTNPASVRVSECDKFGSHFAQLNIASACDKREFLLLISRNLGFFHVVLSMELYTC